MTLFLQRDRMLPTCTQGLLAVNGVFCCFTLEDVVREGPKVIHETAIPAGRYRVLINRSQRYGKLLPQIIDVPGFEGIRIHSGNYAGDTSGCILVGMTRTVDAVWSSREAMDRLQPKIAKAIAKGEQVWIEIENGGRV